MSLDEKVAIVTGGGSGIGEATSRLFAQNGAQVAVLDLVEERAQRVANEINAAQGSALAIKANVATEAEVAAAVTKTLDTYGRIDILVNNAAIAAGDDILTIDESTWDLNLNVVLKSVFLCSKAVLPTMIEQRSGAIVNISSVNGLLGLGEEGYSAAKAGIINLTQNMATKYGQHNVRANVICPGTIQTPIWQARVDTDPEVFDKLAKWYPLGRVGRPEDIAQAVLYLASDAAAWVTGTVLAVDGGLTAGNYGMSQDLGG